MAHFGVIWGDFGFISDDGLMPVPLSSILSRFRPISGNFGGSLGSFLARSAPLGAERSTFWGDLGRFWGPVVLRSAQFPALFPAAAVAMATG